MPEPKSFASLSSSLLARKGAARPAMRRQGMVEIGATPHPVHDDLGWNDMGYDVDFDPTTPDAVHRDATNPLAGAIMDITPEVRRQQELIADRLARQADDFAGHEPHHPAGAGDADAPARVDAMVAPAMAPVIPIPRPAPRARRREPGDLPAKGKAAFTLRLDGSRHLKLRLACALRNESAQRLVTRALDELLAAMPDVDSLVAQVPGAVGQAS